jgi:hypothetical protein
VATNRVEAVDRGGSGGHGGLGDLWAAAQAGPGVRLGALPAAEAATAGTGHGSGHASSVGGALIVTAVS